MSSYPELDLTLPTRDGECIEVTTASFTREGVAEVNVHKDGQGGQWMATIVTAKQVRRLADTFDKLARSWGE